MARRRVYSPRSTGSGRAARSGATAFGCFWSGINSCTTIVIGNGGPGIRGPYSTEPARLQVLCLAMQGLGRPGCNQAKMIEWALERGMDYYYPGYVVPGFEEFDYKHRVGELEYLDIRRRAWRPFPPSCSPPTRV